uniref:Ovule protein n=1 Tax=Steinernema glaseri TaxID=37863 RepID=A0A1I7ZJZ2_9BILA
MRSDSKNQPTNESNEASGHIFKNYGQQPCFLRNVKTSKHLRSDSHHNQCDMIHTILGPHQKPQILVKPTFRCLPKTTQDCQNSSQGFSGQYVRKGVNSPTICP